MYDLWTKEILSKINGWCNPIRVEIDRNIHSTELKKYNVKKLPTIRIFKMGAMQMKTHFSANTHSIDTIMNDLESTLPENVEVLERPELLSVFLQNNAFNEIISIVLMDNVTKIDPY